MYDTVVQYDIPPELTTPPEPERSRRWRIPPHSRSRSRSPSPRTSAPRRSRSFRSRSLSWSPSGRQLECERDYEYRHENTNVVVPERDKNRRRRRGRDATYESRGRREYRRPNTDVDNFRDSTPRADRQDTKYENLSEHDIGQQMGQLGSERVDQQHDGTSDAKGKRRTRESVGEDKDGRPRNLSPIPETVHTTADRLPEPPGVPADERPTRGQPGVQASRKDDFESKFRTSRKKSLLESVHAHLAPQPLPQARGRQSRKQVPEASVITTSNPTTLVARSSHSPTFSVSTPSTKSKSLLARLSDAPPSETDGSERTCTPLSTENSLQTNGDPTGKATRFSAPEIMARTRARLAKLKDDMSPSRDVVEAQQEHATLVDPPIFNQTPDSANTRVRENQDVRSRLQRRLDEEKKTLSSLPVYSRHRESGAPMLAIVPISPVTSPSTSHEEPTTMIGFGDAEGTSSHTAEAKLRLRAHLRIRLAAAKRSV